MESCMFIQSKPPDHQPALAPAKAKAPCYLGMSAAACFAQGLLSMQLGSQVVLSVNLHQATPSTGTQKGSFWLHVCSCSGLQGCNNLQRKPGGEGVQLVDISGHREADMPTPPQQPFTASYITKRERLCLNYTLFILKGRVPLRWPLALEIYGKHVSGLGS